MKMTLIKVKTDYSMLINRHYINFNIKIEQLIVIISLTMCAFFKRFFFPLYEYYDIILMANIRNFIILLLFILTEFSCNDM